MDNGLVRNLILAGMTALLAIGTSYSLARAENHGRPMLNVAMMGGNMMGPGMMRSGMSGSKTANGHSPEGVAHSLEAYIKNRHLMCSSCHAVSGNRMGPSFVEIAHRYAGAPAAEQILAGSIARGVAGKWRGYARMAGRLATPEEARELAHLIMGLSQAK